MLLAPDQIAAEAIVRRDAGQSRSAAEPGGCLPGEPLRASSMALATPSQRMAVGRAPNLVKLPDLPTIAQLIALTTYVA